MRCLRCQTRLKFCNWEKSDVDPIEVGFAVVSLSASDAITC